MIARVDVKQLAYECTALSRKRISFLINLLYFGL